MPAFSAPWALSAGLLAAWLLWRARRPRSNRTHTVANLFLWSDGKPLAAPSGDPDRRRPPWLVWLQAATLVALAVGAAGPARRSAQSDAALIIDVSRSMGAREGGGTRLDLARAAARTWLNHRPASNRVRVMAAGRRPVDTGTFAVNDRALEAALAALAPETASADLAGAVTVARAATAGPIAIVSDLPAPERADGPEIEWLRVGSPLDNVAIVFLRSGGAGRALIDVHNFGGAPQRASLQLRRGIGEIWRQEFVIGAGTSRAFLPVIDPGTTVVSAQLSIQDPLGDALESDDTRTADVSPRPRIRVELVTPGNVFLEQALRALPDVTLEIAKAPPTSAGTPADVIVCDGCQDAPPRPSLWLPPAGGGTPGELPILVMRADHPLLRGVDFSDARVAPTLPPPGAATVLASAGGHTLITADETTAGRQITLAADLSRSSLPLTAAFPIFIANSVDWLARRSPDGLDADAIDAINESNLLHPEPPSLNSVSSIAPSARSWTLAVAFAALVLLALEWAWRRDRPWTRAVAAISIAGAIVGARIPGCASGRAVVFALDGSGSVMSTRQEALDRVSSEISAMSGNDRAGVVVFGERGERVRDLDASTSVDPLSLPAPSAVTNIAAGIRASRQALPESGDRRIVLLTDGQPTTGDALGAAATAGVPVDAVALDDRHAPVIRRLDAPMESRSGVAVPLRADIEGAPGTRLSLDLVRDGSTIDTRAVTLGADGRASVVWTDTPPHAGVVFYHAVAMDSRLGIAVSQAGAGVAVGGRGRILIATDRPGEFSARLRMTDLQVDERTPAALPDTRAALAPYNTIVLDAVAPHRLNSRQLDAISDAVALDGAGLLFLGDRESLNASEFAASRFTDSLPVDFTALPRPPSTSMALALLIDTSGSMASTSDGVTKISAAREAVARALAVVPAGDAVQVISFSATPTVIVPEGDRRDAASVAERLRAMTPSGGTALTPALTQAIAWLRSVPNPVRRILVVSDGRTTPADGETAKACVVGQGIEVSVVAIGNDADRQWLAGLARSTGGRTYFPDTLRELPRDVAREASRGTSREIDERFRVRAGAHPLAPSSPPELGGYVVGQLRPGATAAWKSATEDPVLAAWPRGLGRVAVFASDLRGPWGAPLAAWRDGAAFWQRVVMWLQRGSETTSADAQLETTTAGTSLIVDIASAAVQGEQLPTLSATLLTPSGTTMTLPLHPVTPTRAETPLPLAETGDYRATIVIRDPRTSQETRFMRGWYWSGDLEAQARGVNLPLLQQITARSGGSMLPTGAARQPGAGVFDGPRARTSRGASLELLLLAATLLFLDYSRSVTREARR